MIKIRVKLRALFLVVTLAAVLTGGCGQPGQTASPSSSLNSSQPSATWQLLPNNPAGVISRIDPSWNVSREGLNGVEYYFIDAFSPDGTHVAYSAGTGNGKVFVQLDKMSGKPYDGTFAYTFSPDSRRFTYIAEEGGYYFVVLDGVEGKHYKTLKLPPDTIMPNPSSVSIPVFSPDSRHLAYIAEANGKDRLVLDGAEGKAYDSIAYNPRIGDPGIVFSPDSQRVAFVAATARSATGTRQQFAVIDGVEDKHYTYVSGVTFSPDSKRVAYAAAIGDRWFAIVDGVEQPQSGVYGRVTFSPDSRRVAYAARAQAGNYVVVDGIAGKNYDSVSDPIFSPDSKHVAYSARSGGRSIVVVDGKEGKSYDQVQGLVFSPDGRRVAYEAEYGGEWFVVVDGTEGKRYERISNLLFSPDSEHVAFVSTAHDSRSCSVVLDSVEGRSYSYIYQQPVFSPDSKHLAYSAQDGGGERVIVDGVEGKRYDHIVGGLTKTSLMFDSPSILHYLAESGNDVYLVEETVR